MSLTNGSLPVLPGGKVFNNRGNNTRRLSDVANYLDLLSALITLLITSHILSR